MISENSLSRTGVKELEIFDFFEIDQNLPKYKITHTNQISYGATATVSGFDNSITNPRWFIPPSNDPNRSRLMMRFNNRTGVVEAYLTFRQKIALFFLKMIDKNAFKSRGVKQITVVEFFTQLAKSSKELTPLAEIAEHYEKALVQSDAMGQVALTEQFKSLIEVIRGEAQLIAAGLKKYVTEKQVIDFYEKVGKDKNLKLSWIKNFNRIIPEEVYNIKKDVDERKIFDNYVILHYDPIDDGTKLTKKEIEKKKDPILFGVIRNSRKLYFVADWKDEYCDLTLEEMFKTLGGKVLKINNKTVKTFIDKTKI